MGNSGRAPEGPLLGSRAMRTPPHARLTAVLCAAFALLLAPASAHGHASLLESQPADHSVVSVQPSVIRLTFDEPVKVAGSTVKVFAPSGARVDRGVATVQGAQVRQQVARQGKGTYAVAWRLVSRDGHEIAGTLAFHVGEAGGEATQKGKAATRQDRTTLAVFGVARFLLLVGLLTAVGGALFAVLVVPGWRPVWLLRALGLVLAAAAAAYVCDAALTGAMPLVDALSAEALVDEMENPFGRAMLLLGGCAILACGAALSLTVADSRPSAFARTVALLLFVALAVTLSLSGHAYGAADARVRVPVDALHVLAAALWIGGLVQLRAMVPNARAHVFAIRRFSSIAIVAVFVLLATGAYATWAELGMRPHELLDSQYGRIVLAKLLLFAGTLPLAFMNRSAYVPAIASRPGQASALLRQYVFRELFLLLTILALTAWLVRTAPPA